MNRIAQATECYNNNKFDEAEKLALEELFENSQSHDAIDVLSAVFLKTGQSCLLDKSGQKYLQIIRQVAVMLNELSMYPHAMAFFRKALELDKRDSVALNNMGLIYETIQEDELAKECYEKALKIRQEYESLYNLGIYYRKQKDTDTAIKYVTRALQLKPNDPQTEYSLGMLYFMDGNFDEGYKHFLKRDTKIGDFLQNSWDGTPHQDQDVLVYCDYGLGDALMYSRYFPFLKKMFKNVKVYCRKNLESIFSLSFPDIEFSSDISKLPYNYSTLAMNLPYYLKMDFSQIPSSDGYLKVDENKIKEYKEKYFKTDKPKIGIFWVGGEKTKRTARTRFMALHEMKKIIDMDKYQFYSFQVEDPFEEVKMCPKIVDLGSTFNDFSDTAAAMKNLDLFISIDSSVIHLAGAIGVKSYLMLPKSSEWRWFKDSKHTVWYDSVEIFAQKTLYDWTYVVDEICKKLP